MKYVVFLRGINVGGNKKVPMVDLKKMLEKMGCTEVKTILNSGNVVLDSMEKNIAVFAKKIEVQFEKTFGFDSHIIIRTLADIQALADSAPFKKIPVTEHTRLYITFLSEKPKNTLKIPYVSPAKDFTILKASDTEICSVLVLSPATDSTKVMAVIEKEFGKNVTTRNWNTIEKLLK
jgi:uncharacterized protein (DUF1697 family)